MSFIKKKRLKRALSEMMQCAQRDHSAFLPQGKWKCSNEALNAMLPVANDYAQLLMIRAIEFAQATQTKSKKRRQRVTTADLELAFEAIQMENTTF
jgi:hypothetical protein